MTALVAVFRRGEACYQWPVFWLPEATAHANDHLAPFLNWAAGGWLRLIPGEVIQDHYIEETLAEFAERFRVQGIWYDRTYCEDITQWAEDDLGFVRTEFPQTTQMFAGPIEEYERAIILGTLKHPNHPVLNWQAGHCQVHTDSKARKTLIKPKHGDIKKIDGMVAGVMAYFGCTSTPVKKESVYKRRGVIAL